MPSKRYDYGVPKELSRSAARIYTLAIEGDQFLIEFFDKENRMVKVKSHISGNKDYDLNNLKDAVSSKLSYYFEDVISTDLTNKLVDVAAKVYDNHATYVIENIRRKHKADEAKFGPLEDEDSQQKKQGEQKPVFVVKKFTSPTTVSPNGAALAEAVLINGKPQFAVTINGGLSVNFFNELETADMILQPPTKQEYPPNSAYEFESEDELMEYIQFAIEKDSLYKLLISVREFYTKEYFVDTDPKNSTMLALFTITSYFQDKFSTVPYIWLIGDNGSGKNSIEIIYSRLGYRVFYMTGANGANLCEYLGFVEEGQGTIAEDELRSLDQDEYKKILFMSGYASGSCVPKILDGNTKGRDQLYYRAYCQKMGASETLPSIKDSKGVHDRTFPIKCVKGFPKYNAKMLYKKTKTSKVLELQMRLEIVRKRLFAFRLVHFGDVVPEIQGLNISGRALELTESALLLFHKYRSSPEEDEIFNKGILPTLSDFLKDRLGRRNLSLEAKLYPIITKMVQEQGETLENDKIFATVQSEMEGKPIPEKDYVFYAEDLERLVSRNDIFKVLKEKFKAVSSRKVDSENGSRYRVHVISKETLERIKASYEDPWEIKVIPLEEPSAQVDQADQALDQKDGQNDISKPEERHSSHEEVKPENIPNEPENGQKEAVDNKKNSDPIGIGPGQAGQVGQSYSIEEIVSRAMGDKGYLTKDDFIYVTQMAPNLHWSDDDAQQTFHQLIQEGKLVEFESGKYRPTEKLREGGGD